MKEIMKNVKEFNMMKILVVINVADAIIMNIIF